MFFLLQQVILKQAAEPRGLPEPGPNLTTIAVTFLTTLATIFTAYFGWRQHQRMKARRSERPDPPTSDPSNDPVDDTDHASPQAKHHKPNPTGRNTL